jgi:hypothetical protein
LLLRDDGFLFSANFTCIRSKFSWLTSESETPVGPHAGAKRFRNAAVVIGNIELAGQIRKGQFRMGKLGGGTARIPEIWQAALAA